MKKWEYYKVEKFGDYTFPDREAKFLIVNTNWKINYVMRDKSVNSYIVCGIGNNYIRQQRRIEKGETGVYQMHYDRD